MSLDETVECHGEVLNRFVKCRCGEELVIEGIIQSAQNVVEGITEREAFAEAASKTHDAIIEIMDIHGSDIGWGSVIGRLADYFEARAEEGA